MIGGLHVAFPTRFLAVLVVLAFLATTSSLPEARADLTYERGTDLSSQRQRQSMAGQTHKPRMVGPKKVDKPLSPREALQAAQKQFKQRLKKNGYRLTLYPQEYEDADARRGIVISAGGQKLLTNAYVVIRVLRDVFRCTLPVEVVYHGAKEVHKPTFTALRSIRRLRIRDATQHGFPAYHTWKLPMDDYVKKVFALYTSGFQQALMLDADSQPMTDLTALFELPAFKENGGVFWPDYWKAYSALEAPQDEVYHLLGLPLPWRDNPEWQCVESGQILFDRVRHVDVLEWVMFLNSWSSVLYKLVLGDKDLWEMAFMLAGKHRLFYRIPVPPRSAMTILQDDGTYHHVGIVQSSAQGQPIFLHRTTGGKFNPAVPAAKHMRPVFITEPLSVAAAKQFIWHTQLAINTLPVLAATEQPTCLDLDSRTVETLQRGIASGAIGPGAQLAARRFSGCNAEPFRIADFPTPLLRVELYGAAVADSMEYSFEALAQLQASLPRPARKQRLRGQP